MGDTFLLGEHAIGPGHPPLVVAELSGNHNGSLQRAMDILEASAVAGAHAVKLQTYTADTMTLDCAKPGFSIEDPSSLWAGSSLHALYQKAATPWEWHAPLFQRCRELGMLAFSTPFDATAVDFLETLKVPCYKIASFEVTDLPLIRKAAATGKPLILSTGMATIDEIAEAVAAARGTGCRDLVLLKCTSAYPAPPEHCNLMTIPDMRSRFGCLVGVSDHTPGIGVPVVSVALGACLIEKHVTLRRCEGGVDAAFSLEPEELRSLVIEVERAWHALGQVSYGPSLADEASLAFRRSLYAVSDIAADELLTQQNVRAIRPGFGLPPKHYQEVLGRKAARRIERGTPLSWEDIGR